METASTILRIAAGLTPFFSLSIILYVQALTNRRIHGRYIKGKYAVKFLTDHFELGYQWDGPIIGFFPKPAHFQNVSPIPFISHTFGCIFSKWKIQGYGRILRFSKAHRMIERRIARERASNNYWI